MTDSLNTDQFPLDIRRKTILDDNNITNSIYNIIEYLIHFSIRFLNYSANFFL